MTKFKKSRIYVKIDEQNQFWVVAESGRLIRNPTKEDLTGTNLRSYSSTNICPECRKENNIIDRSILYPKNARHKYDEKGNMTEEYLCEYHGNVSRRKNDPLGSNNLRKLSADRRTGNLTDSAQILGDKCQKVTVLSLGPKDLNEELDNFNSPIDHTPIPDGTFVEIGEKLADLSGTVIQTKGCNFHEYIGRDGGWYVGNLIREYGKEFDFIIFYCISKDEKTIERIYIFPKAVLNGIGINIIKDAVRGSQWYNSYIVTDKKYSQKTSEIWETLNKV